MCAFVTEDSFSFLHNPYTLQATNDSNKCIILIAKMQAGLFTIENPRASSLPMLA